MMMDFNFKFLTLSVTSVLILQLNTVISAKYSEQKLKSIGKIRNILKDELYQDYMKSDDYLFSWLKGHNMNVESATEMLRNSLKWRKANDVDSLINNTDLNCDRDYPFYISGIDKTENPVVEMNIKEWDIRKQTLAGKSVQFMKCQTRLLEITSAKLRAINATQFTFICNLQGYNLRQHACVACIPPILNGVISYEANYPGIVKHFFLVNTPSFFEALLTILRPVLSQETKDNLHVHGLDSKQWKAALANIISKEQLRPVYGGSNKFSGLGANKKS